MKRIFKFFMGFSVVFQGFKKILDLYTGFEPQRDVALGVSVHRMTCVNACVSHLRMENTQRTVGADFDVG